MKSTAIPATEKSFSVRKTNRKIQVTLFMSKNLLTAATFVVMSKPYHKILNKQIKNSFGLLKIQGPPK